MRCPHCRKRAVRFRRWIVRVLWHGFSARPGLRCRACKEPLAGDGLPTAAKLATAAVALLGYSISVTLLLTIAALRSWSGRPSELVRGGIGMFGMLLVWTVPVYLVAWWFGRYKAPPEDESGLEPAQIGRAHV